MTCSIVTACMNRNIGLLQGLKSWLKLNVEEIIIVDWSSEHEVKETLASHNIVDPRIKIIRVEAEKYWNLTRAFNLGFQHVSSETVIKVDAEVTISENFLAQHTLQTGVYYRGGLAESRE